VAKPSLLIVEDDEAVRTQLKYGLRDDFDLWLAEDRPQAMTLLAEHKPGLVSLDLGLPPHADTAEEGLQALSDIMERAPATKVVVVTGNADRENAYRAIQLGAFDFLQKPADLEEFRVILRRANHLQALEAESAEHARTEQASARFADIVGSTPSMREIYALVSRVARTDATVLIQGESGTGKELIARAIHGASPRRARPFVAINCGAIPETLLEAELFGHEKGAYTGAHVARKGKLETAQSGTLFLDEIAEMTVPLQVKLLRFLQERKVERVGGRELIAVDARVLAATNKDLKTAMQTGEFREDLYYRLSVVNIKVPPLRERGEDVVLLANAFLKRSCEEHRRKLRFSPKALEALTRYAWPGNVRELENAVERAVIMAPGRLVEPPDLGIELSGEGEEAAASLREARGRAERELLVEAMARHRGNVSKAAQELGVSRPTFHGLLTKHQVNAKDFR